MSKAVVSIIIAAAMGLTLAIHAEAQVKIQRHALGTQEFRFDQIRSPSKGDLAAQGTFSIVTGTVDPNSAGLKALNDDSLPQDEDAPRANFFFQPRTKMGRIFLELPESAAIRQINTYSWHPNSRGPQVYKVYGSEEGKTNDLENLESAGWKRIAEVDTRPESGEPGGQHGVSTSDSGGPLGRFRYLLFEMLPTDAADPFGQTFFSEIDVIGADNPEPIRPAVASGAGARKVVEAGEGKYRITIDGSETPYLQEWIDKELIPVVQEWYPKIVAMLPSEGYTAPAELSIFFSKDMPGVANASGTRIRASGKWIANNLDGEAKGAIVHELVHVVQQYGRGRRNNPDATRTPGWIVEGIPDYIRWFLYEKDSTGAEITSRNLSRARYDANYRITANFIDWVVKNHDPEIHRKLNAAAREARYTDDLWKEYTGHTLEELGAEWKAAQEKKIASEGTGSSSP